MASNYIQPGHTLPLPLPYARSTGEAFKLGEIIAVAAVSGAQSDVVESHVEGVFEITALSTDTANPGTIFYWDDTNKRLTTTSSTHKKVGYAVVAKTNGQTTARVKLIPLV